MRHRSVICRAALIGFALLFSATLWAQEQPAQSFPLNGYNSVLDGQWEGIRYASDGNVYFASSTHSAHHGASFFKYNPITNQITLLAEDITVICGEDPVTNPQGKIHSAIVEANGWLYFTTHFSSELPGAYDHWTGSHLVGYELATGLFRDYGVVHPNYTSYSGVGVDPERGYVYVYVTGQAAGQVSYIYRVDILSGAKTNLGQVGGTFYPALWTFVDRRGDVWLSTGYANGDLLRVRGNTGQIDVYPNALPPLYRWDAEVLSDAQGQGDRAIMWMQALDGDRALFTMGWQGGMLYLFDSSKPIGSGQEFQQIKHIGNTEIGLALGKDRLFYYQRANRGLGQQEAQDFHLMSVSLDAAAGYPITDHGLLKDQDGRLVWRVPGMTTDGKDRVYMVGDWWTVPGDLGTRRYTYNNGVETYEPLPRGEFFAFADTLVPPSVQLTAPTAGTRLTTPASVELTADAADGDGTVAQVGFYAYDTLLGIDTDPPYSFTWVDPPLGTYDLTARATDNAGNSTSSAPVSVTLLPEVPPTVRLTAPSNGAHVTAPPSLELTADASDDNGNLASVSFYADDALLGFDTTAPYSFTWVGPSLGTHQLTARAADSKGNSSTSTTVTVILDPTPSTTPATASFLGVDSTTQGTWQGAYGRTGYVVVNSGAASLPSFAQVTPSGQASFTWADQTTDTRALQRADTTGRRAATWYTATTAIFTIDVNFTDGQPHQVALYALDWDTNARRQRIDVINAATGAVLDSREMAGFQGGQYWAWRVTGRVLFRVTHLGGFNAVVGALFLDPDGSFAPPPPAPVTTPTAGFVGIDSTTRGTWQGAYGRTGYVVVNSGTSLPSFAQVTPSGQASFTWADQTTDARALQRADTTGRRAATWYTATTAIFTVEVNFTDDQPHQVALYALDWDTNARRQRVDVINAATGAVLDSREMASFQGGQYWAWRITGRVLFRVTHLGGFNAVVGGLFIDP